MTHAVGLQYCSAKSTTTLDEDFWSWLEDRPETLLSLAATTYPVSAKVWENMERLWREPEFRAKADGDAEFRSHLVGFAYMQRKTSVEEVVNLHWTSAHGDGYAGCSISTQTS